MPRPYSEDLRWRAIWILSFYWGLLGISPTTFRHCRVRFYAFLDSLCRNSCTRTETTSQTLANRLRWPDRKHLHFLRLCLWFCFPYAWLFYPNSSRDIVKVGAKKRRSDCVWLCHRFGDLQFCSGRHFLPSIGLFIVVLKILRFSVIYGGVFP